MDHEEAAFYRRANRVCVTTSGERYVRKRGGAEAGDQRADLLSLEAPLRGFGGGGAAAAQATGGREPQAQAAGGGSEPRQEDAAGRPVKKSLKPRRRRLLVRELQVAYQVSERRACRALRFPRSSQRYVSVRGERTDLRVRLRDLAAVRVRYGYRRLHVLLQREGWRINHKLVYRLYSEEGLMLRPKRAKRHRSSQARSERHVADRANG